MTEFDSSGAMKWERIIPPLYWRIANLFIVADRHSPDGTRQHLVQGSQPAGTVINNADVFGEYDIGNIEYSSKLSHLSSL